MALIISEAQTRKLIDMPQAINVVEKMFYDRAAGKVRSLPRQRLKGSLKQLNMMAAWHEDWDLLCLRAYTSEANTITVYSGRTGNMQAILNARYLSSLRTAAASGVAAKYLAPATNEVLGLVGSGWQAAFQLEAIVPSCGVRQVLVFGRNATRRKEFVRQMRKKLSVDLAECPSVDEIEERSGILVVATDSTAPVIYGAKLREDVLIISMGANQAAKHEVSGELVRQMDLVVTDDLPTAQTGSGDLIAACEAGIIRWEDVVPLERLMANGRPANRPERILFQSNGIADEDLAVGRYVLEQVRKKKVKVRKVNEI